MAYLLLIIIAALFLAVMSSPISISLIFDSNISIILSLPFFDYRIYPSGKKRFKRDKFKGIKKIRNSARILKAFKHSLDLLIGSASVTLINKDESDIIYPQNRAQRILFSLFVSYLASKSGILITDKGNGKSQSNRNFIDSAVVKTRAYRLFLALISFVAIRFLPKKEYGIVGK
jgi:hypothetical protein